MDKQKLSVFVILLLLSLSSISIIFAHAEVTVDEHDVIENNCPLDKSSKMPQPRYSFHSPIRINNNTDLATQANYGSGTEADPYVIEGWEIDGGQECCIYVGNTTDYFVVKNCYLYNSTDQGIYLKNTSLGSILNNEITLNRMGMYLKYSNNTKIRFNNISSNEYGMQLTDSNQNIIEGNNITFQVFTAFKFYTSHLNNINNNTFKSNDMAISMSESTNNTLFNNTIIHNDCGFNFAEESYDNYIYSNNFINNTYQTMNFGTNIWNSSYPEGGNYWDDYNGYDNYSGPNQDIPGSDGIGDTPYTNFDNFDRDYYPLMFPTFHEYFNIDLNITSENDGWNFISSRLAPRNKNINEFLSDIDGSYDKVLYYNNPYNTVVHTVWEDDFESDKGWTFSGGEWEWGEPNGLGGSCGNPDPNNSVSGSKIIGYDLSGTGTYPGDYENSLSETYWAVSPTIDLTEHTDIKLRFYRWLGVESNVEDFAYIYAYDGATWQEVWSNPGPSLSDDSWKRVEHDVSMYADGNSNFQFAFGMGTTDSADTYCGWNIDDVQLIYRRYEPSDHFSEWETYVPTRSEHFNSLENYDTSMGIWIHMTSNDTLDIDGVAVYDTTIKLDTGWNMVGYPSDDKRIASDVFPSEVTKIGVFNASREYNIEYIYDLSTYTMKEGEGYWVYNSADFTVDWDIEY
ncbi:MAG: right-handed parallel beta-helix repeat-containing protein [Thermoplasmata archaeon]